jgi:tRNA dimethylallyltransferase
METLAHPLIVLVGPTAAGKSAVASRLADERGAEIVSCDSLQVYRGLDIGSAKPTTQERRRIPHHLIDVVGPEEPFSAADYAALARAALADVAARGRMAIVAGGTGLYLRALLSGLFEGPSRDETLRRRLEAVAARSGESRLHGWLARVDPEAAARIAPRDRMRVIRALEVFRTTGRRISDHHRTDPAPLRGFRPGVFGIAPDRRVLKRSVIERTQGMWAAGLLAEVDGLLGQGLSADLRPLQAIGYRQAVGVLRGVLTPEEAQHDMVIATMRYAKRQMTWFRHQLDVVWAASPDEAYERCIAWLNLEGQSR